MSSASAAVVDIVYVGIKGSVVALDRDTGQRLWTLKLKGTEFVNLTLDGDRLFAATKGEIYCLDAEDGSLQWQNRLPGLGTGLASIVTLNAPNGGPGAAQEKARLQEEAAAAIEATSAGFTSS